MTAEVRRWTCLAVTTQGFYAVSKQLSSRAWFPLQSWLWSWWWWKTIDRWWWWRWRFTWSNQDYDTDKHHLMCLRVALPVRPPIINTAMPPVYRVIKILAKICINFGECCAGGKLLFGADRWLLNRLWICSTDQPSPNNPCTFTATCFQTCGKQRSTHFPFPHTKNIS